MTPERWRQIRSIYERASSLHEKERSAFLSSTCLEDGALRAEVESLLASENRVGSAFLETPVVGLLDSFPDREETSLATGCRIGAYEIAGKIGSGGMGEVYRAVRADGQYSKAVAIKLVRKGLDTSAMLGRFRNERQILATLEHPNIARLLDGGALENGTPYLVMELIDGLPIDKYCDLHNLDVTERLRLFSKACDAVHYAHQRLVTHRDIKPGNILVTEEGVPKLLDFGIAKVLDPTAASEVTQIRPMTPEYASPEQIRGEAITTASDVYSLGVVLYRLLTGRSPYSLASDTPHQLSRAVTDTEAVRPSAIVLKSSVGTKDPAYDSLCKSREGSAEKLRRRLVGDLDEIVLMALRKEPDRRYGTVQQFADDISRHLEGRPVTASKGTWNYRAEKFVRRHKAGALAAVLAILGLLTGVGLIVREGRIARVERQRAEARFNDVRKLSNSLIFDVNDSMANLPGNTKARKVLLDHAVEYLDKLSQDTGGNTDLQRELAFGYQRLAVVQGNTMESNVGDVAGADVSLLKAMALFESVAKANPGSTEDQLNLATILRRKALSDAFYPSGREGIEKAMAITDRLMTTAGNNAKVLAERSIEYQTLSYAQSAAGEHSGAIQSIRSALALARRVRSIEPANHENAEGIVKFQVLLGDLLTTDGEVAEAQETFDEIIAEYEVMAKPEPRPSVRRDLAATRCRLGEVRMMLGNYSGAEQQFRLVRSQVDQLVSEDPDSARFQSDEVHIAFDEARLLALTGKSREASAKLRDAIYKYDHIQSDAETESPGKFLAWLAEAQVGMRDYGGALKSLQDGLAKLQDADYPVNRSEIAAVEVRIGDVLSKLKRLDEAAASYQKALGQIGIAPAVEPKDIGTLYPIADAYFGLGSISMQRSASARGAGEMARLQHDACASFQRAADTWHQVKQPTKFAPNDFPAGDPRQVANLLSACSVRALPPNQTAKMH